MPVSKSVASVGVVIKVGNQLIGGQLGATLNRETQTADITTKSCNGKREYIIISDTWNVECDGFYRLNDMGLELLMDSVMNHTPLDIQIQVAKDYVLSGKCLVESFPLQLPDKKEVKYELTLLGSGDLEKSKITAIEELNTLKQKEELK